MWGKEAYEAGICMPAFQRKAGGNQENDGGAATLILWRNITAGKEYVPPQCYCSGNMSML